MTALPAAMLQDKVIGNKTECIATNGTGSFASISVNGGLARKFHGLLIHSMIPPMDRLLTWHHCAETFAGVSLDARQWLEDGEHKSNHGERFLNQFHASPIPTWIYEVNGYKLKKELYMQPGEPTSILKYSLLAGPTASVPLTLENYVHFRAAEGHSPTLSSDELSHWQVDSKQHRIKTDQVCLRLSCQTPGNLNTKTEHWHTAEEARLLTNLAYPIELEDQGYDHYDCSLHVQTIDVILHQGESCYMVGTLQDQWPDSERVYQQVIEQRKQRLHSNDFANDLAHSALQLVADRQSVNGKTILAGFPWFGDWGRDTMIALPGTTLVTGQFETARSILKTFAHYLCGGMLPNKFPDRHGEELKYNTIDATLWFFWAIQQYVHYSNDWQFVKTELYQDLLDILKHHQKGTRYGIGSDDDGLIQGGDENTQLTWMDVKFDNTAVTPRYGKAVEINALWYNALNFTEQCARNFDDHSTQLEPLISKVRDSFQKTFWNSSKNCCYDYVVDGTSFDDIRCNQIFAVSLPFSPLTAEQQRQTFHTVYKQLYTPVGLRSLSPDHTDYKGVYYGDLPLRDVAYHQGTVWAWPMGGFIDAAMRVTNDKVFAARLLTGMKQHFYFEAGANGISEVFDGNAPHHARGCFNQAWSVAETLRVIDKYELDVCG